MSNCKNCSNCAWFCHADGKCYGNHFMAAFRKEAGLSPDCRGVCGDWAFDGLEDWERETPHDNGSAFSIPHSELLVVPAQ